MPQTIATVSTDDFVYGLAWTGSELWGTGTDTSSWLFRIDPATGDTLQKTDFNPDSPVALTWDGSHLWMIREIGGSFNLSRIVDPYTIELDLSFPLEGLIYGLTWDGSAFWIDDLSTGQLHRVDPADGSIIRSIPAPAGAGRGITWDGASLWFVNFPDTIYQVDPSDGTVLSSFPSPEATEAGPSGWGVAWQDDPNGDILWHTGFQGRLHKIVGFNQPPNVPTPLSPIGGTKVDRSQPIILSSQFNDPDPGDSPSASQWRYRIRDIGASWKTVMQPNPLQTYTIPAGLAAGGYEWQSAYADQSGTWGPFCSSEFFTAADPPPGPVWLDPIAGQTIGLDYYTFVFSAPNVDESEFTLYADDGAGNIDTSTILQGPVTQTPATVPDVRRHTFTGLANKVPIWASVRYKYQGIWSQPAQQRNPVSYTPPPTPTFVKTDDPANGRLLVAITNPPAGAGEPAVAYNDVYVTDPGRPEERRVTGSSPDTPLPPNGTWAYDTPVSGYLYDGTDGTSIRVEAVATNGTTSTTTA